MKRILLILILSIFFATQMHGQSFNVNDLVNLSSLAPKNIDHFMYKKGFAISFAVPRSDTTGVTYGIKPKARKNYDGPQKSIDILVKNDSKYFTYHTSSLSEYLDGKRSLIKDGFFYGTEKNVNRDSLTLFQKANMSIEAGSEVRDSTIEYIFKLKAKKIPDSVIYAEDLLQFDSNEFLVSFFGEKNVKKDMYYFSEKELKKCSVLFNGTKYQAVFIWGNETELNNLSYILVTNVLPTEGGKRNAFVTENNEWKFKSGIHLNMPLRELLRLNKMDFYIYGNKSDLAFMVKPEQNGKINFKKTGLMLSCNNCYDNEIFDQREISALDIAKANLPMRVFDVIIYP